MDRKHALIQAWDATFDKEGWYPPLKSALANVSAAQASWKPDADGLHSIAELVSHLVFYKERFLFRLQGREFTRTAQTNDDTFSLDQALTESSWKALVEKLEEVHLQIRQRLSQLDEAGLDAAKPEEPVGAQVWNLVLHDAYHTGQIIDIRKLQASWPARTDY